MRGLAGNYVYKNGELQFFNHPEGYVERENDGTYSFVYQYKDHLGNIRLSYSDRDKDGKVDVLRNTTDVDGDGDLAMEIKEVKDYYPFGLEQQRTNDLIVGREHKYGYNGKEENNELGLAWLDYGFRNYDASIARFMNIDPAADLYGSWTPYHYVMNNPMIFIDPTGAFTELFDRDGNKIGEDENGNDGKVSIISNDEDVERIKKNTEEGNLASQEDIDGGVKTTKTVLGEALNVLKRTKKNGGDDEETSLVMNNGTIIKGKGKGNNATVPNPPQGESNEDATSIHSHPLNYIINERNNAVSHSALHPSATDTDDSDEQVAVFNKYPTNIIVGRLGATVAQFNRRGKAVVKKKNLPSLGAVIYTSNKKPTSLTEKALKRIVRK